MTNTTIAEFWEMFETLGKEKLQSAGISYQLISNLDDYYLEMKLQRNANEYILSFSIHHLDYNDGVKVYNSRYGKIDHRKVVLPFTSNPEERYGYIEPEIKRLIEDLVKYL